MLPISYIIPPWFDPQIHPRQFCRCRWTYTEDLGRYLLAASRLVANAVLRCCENLGVTVVSSSASLFQQQGIRIPYPKRDLYVRSDAPATFAEAGDGRHRRS